MIFDVNDLTDKPKKQERKMTAQPFDSNKVIKMHKHLKMEKNEFFTEEKFPHGFVFYDFEVFLYDWMVVLIDPINCTKDIIVNDRQALRDYYHEHIKMIWAGYNSSHYDVSILKGIILGMNPKKVSDAIIVEHKSQWEINKDFYKVDLISYDVMTNIPLPNSPSLKVLEANMGDNIKETDVPFDIPRQLVLEEIQETIKYCIHDVEETIKVFEICIDEFNGIMSIIDMFDFPIEYVGKTKGQLTALVVDCEKQEHDDEFDITILPCVQLEKYKYVQDWFIQACKNHNYSAKLETNICGVPHKFGWGGLHGASNSPVHKEGKTFHADVGSYYPSQMIEWKLLTRNCKSPEKFKNVYDMRMALKKAGKKKEQGPLKIILNSQYGITKDKYSTAYDPVQANNICVNGQLMLLDLIEHLEKFMKDDFELIQSNTDGIIVKIKDDDIIERRFKHICNDWCNRTRMTFAYDRVDWYVAKDVNNYIFAFTPEDKTKKLYDVLKQEFPEISLQDNKIIL